MVDDKRRAVFAAINSEREYQDAKWTGHRHEVGAYLTMLRSYLHEAEENWTRNNGDGPGLNSIRKIAGIATACMEEHGAPMRIINPIPTNI